MMQQLLHNELSLQMWAPHLGQRRRWTWQCRIWFCQRSMAQYNFSRVPATMMSNDRSSHLLASHSNPLGAWYLDIMAAILYCVTFAGLNIISLGYLVLSDQNVRGQSCLASIKELSNLSACSQIIYCIPASQYVSQRTRLSNSCKTLIGEHEMHGWMHPQLKSCNYFVGPWPPVIIGLPYDYQHPSGSRQLLWLPTNQYACFLIWLRKLC